MVQAAECLSSQHKALGSNCQKPTNQTNKKPQTKTKAFFKSFCMEQASDATAAPTLAN
jgi:hypothetical protein